MGGIYRNESTGSICPTLADAVRDAPVCTKPARFLFESGAQLPGGGAPNKRHTMDPAATRPIVRVPAHMPMTSEPFGSGFGGGSASAVDEDDDEIDEEGGMHDYVNDRVLQSTVNTLNKKHGMPSLSAMAGAANPLASLPRHQAGAHASPQVPRTSHRPSGQQPLPADEASDDSEYEDVDKTPALARAISLRATGPPRLTSADTSYEHVDKAVTLGRGAKIAVDSSYEHVDKTATLGRGGRSNSSGSVGMAAARQLRTPHITDGEEVSEASLSFSLAWFAQTVAARMNVRARARTHIHTHNTQHT
jgi:hypothetical protein